MKAALLKAVNALRRAPLMCVIGFVRLYQLLFSSFFGRSCRFYPTCSSYTISSLRQHGVWRGVVLSVRRLVRCHPWHPGGYDPVPQVFSLFGRRRSVKTGSDSACGCATTARSSSSCPSRGTTTDRISP